MAAKGKRRRRVLLTLLAVCLPLIVLIGIREWQFGIPRTLRMLLYGNAIQYHVEHFGRLPRTQEELAAYNDDEWRRGELPTDPAGRWPTIRPIDCPGRGPFLFLIEPEPAFSDRSIFVSRFVWYVPGDVTTLEELFDSTCSGFGMKALYWWWQLDDAIAADDALREQCKANAATTTPGE